MALRKRILDILTITSGSGFSWTGIAAGRAGELFLTGASTYKSLSPTSKAAAAALTAAELLTTLIQYTGAAASLTMPAAATLDAGVSANAAVNDGWEFSIVNTGSGTVTLVGATGVTILGGATVAAGASGRWQMRKTATSGSWSVWRIA